MPASNKGKRVAARNAKGIDVTNSKGLERRQISGLCEPPDGFDGVDGREVRRTAIRWERFDQIVITTKDPHCPKTRKNSKRQRHHLTPTAEGPLSISNTCLPRQLRYQMRRNQVAELPQNGVLGDGWNGPDLLFHPRLVAGRNHSFQPLLSLPYGMLLIRYCFSDRWCSPCYWLPSLTTPHYRQLSCPIWGSVVTIG